MHQYRSQATYDDEKDTNVKHICSLRTLFLSSSVPGIVLSVLAFNKEQDLFQCVPMLDKFSRNCLC